jgi:hypothetical protein
MAKSLLLGRVCDGGPKLTVGTAGQKIPGNGPIAATGDGAWHRTGIFPAANRMIREQLVTVR